MVCESVERRTAGRGGIGRAAFTLIELLVVIAIIVIIVAISIPAIKALTKGNDSTQATNMLSSLIANARSLAISQGRCVALVLYEGNKGASGQTSAVYAAEDRATTTQTDLYLVPLGSGSVQQLPIGAKVAAIDANSGQVTANAAGTTPARAIMFDESGQLLVRGGLHIGTTGDATTLAEWTADWGWTGTETSSPGFVVYSGQELKDAAPASTSQWLVQNSKVLVVNAYTGTVIR